MTSKTVRLDWVKDQVFLLQDHAGFPVVVTEPMGASAADLLPMSLIGCTCWDIVSIMRKQRQELLRLEVTAESEQDEDPPWRFRRIRIHYRFVGRGLEGSKIERAIALAENKYCAVYATLRDSVEISSGYEAVEA